MTVANPCRVSEPLGGDLKVASDSERPLLLALPSALPLGLGLPPSKRFPSFVANEHQATDLIQGNVAEDANGVFILTSQGEVERWPRSAIYAQPERSAAGRVNQR